MQLRTERLVCTVRAFGGYREVCSVRLTRHTLHVTGEMRRRVAVLNDPLWPRTCKDMPRVEREIAKAETSTRPDLRRAAQAVRQAMRAGDKRAFFLAMRDIDPPCAYLFDYS